MSKYFLDIVRNNNGNEINLLPLLELSCSSESGANLQELLHRLYLERNKLQRYVEVKIIDVHKFGTTDDDWKALKAILIDLPLQLTGVVSLDMSLPPSPVDQLPGALGSTLALVLASILPNLREVNLSNTKLCCEPLQELTETCPRLEKITWNNIDRDFGVSIDGEHMMSATNLKELYMDDAVFCGPFPSILSDMENDDYRSKMFLFHMCSTVLERVSIKNVAYGYGRDVLPQNALIKFIRNAPSTLRWFRSDLTHKNIAILRLERPDIEFVNDELDDEKYNKAKRERDELEKKKECVIM